jgi:cytochrome c553
MLFFYKLHPQFSIMKKSVFVIILFSTAIAISFAFVTADTPTYKNLKVLKKNTTKQELDSVMHFFTTSLGEKCGFCHFRNEATKSVDFSSDENPNKNVARYMMRMNAKINKKYFKDKDKDQSSTQTIQAVTCYTCHHGEAMPLTKAAAMPKGNMGGGNRQDSTKRLPGDTTKAPQ